MQRIFGVKKEKAPSPSLQETTDRLNARGDNLDERIRKAEAELVRYRDQMKKMRPGPAQEAVKQRAMRVLKQKKMLESQRDNLMSQSYNLDQVAFAAESMKDAQATVTAMKQANKDLKSHMKTFNLSDVDKVQDDMFDFMDYTNELQEALGRSYDVPDYIDEDDLLGELDALEADMGAEGLQEDVPSYLLPDSRADTVADELADLHLPSAPTAAAVSVDPTRTAASGQAVPELARPLRS